MTQHTSTINSLDANNSSSGHRATRRTRSALGFASGIAATLIAGTVFAAVTTNAAPAEGESTFVPISPCRVLDTRPAPDNVGARNTPLGADETYVQAIGGTNGNCTLPEKISGVALNATALNATAPTFVTFGPAGEATPDTSNLNVLPNQPPTPNKVDVKVSQDGEVAVYNAFGSLDLIIDVTGYYTSDTLTEMSDAISELQASRPFVKSASDSGMFLALPLGSTNKNILSIPVPDGYRGHIVADFSVTVDDETTGDSTRCAVGTESEALSIAMPPRFESPGADGSYGVLSDSRVFSANGDVSTLYVVCRSDTNALLYGRSLTATFFPQP